MTLPRALIYAFKKLVSDKDLFSVFDRYSGALKKQGFIEPIRWNQDVPEMEMRVSLTGWRLTEKGREEYRKWKSEENDRT